MIRRHRETRKWCFGTVALSFEEGRVNP